MSIPLKEREKLKILSNSNVFQGKIRRFKAKDRHAVSQPEETANGAAAMWRNAALQ